MSFAAGADGYYSAQQAERGRAAFNSNCASCHGDQLQGGVGPSLKGTDFLGTWGTADGVYQYFSVAMPPTAPGKLGDQTYTDILAYILSVNGIPQGSEDLGSSKQARQAINLVAAARSSQAAAPQQHSTATAQPEGTKVPQAYTFGRSLPTMQPDGSIADVAAPVGAGKDAKPAVPQAYTFGKPLPTVQPDGSIAETTAPKPAGDSAKPAVPQAYTFGKDLPGAKPAGG